MTLPLSYRYARALLSAVVIAGFAAGGYLAYRRGLATGVVDTARDVAAWVVAQWGSM